MCLVSVPGELCLGPGELCWRDVPGKLCLESYHGDLCLESCAQRAVYEDGELCHSAAQRRVEERAHQYLLPLCDSVHRISCALHCHCKHVFNKFG